MTVFFKNFLQDDLHYVFGFAGNLIFDRTLASRIRAYNIDICQRTPRNKDSTVWCVVQPILYSIPHGQSLLKVKRCLASD